MIDKDAGQLFADRFGEQDRRNGAVHTAGQGTEHFSVSDFRADFRNGVLNKGIHAPVSGTAADFADEGVENFSALFGVDHFRMELNGIELPVRVLHGSDGTIIGVRGDRESRRGSGNVVGMGHPEDGMAGFLATGLLRRDIRCGDILQQSVMAVDDHLGVAVLADRCGFDRAAESVGHELCTVADSENRNAEVKNGGVIAGGVVLKDALRTAGKNDALVVLRLNLLQRSGIRQNFGVDMLFADAPRNELVVLSAEVENQDGFMLNCHGSLLSLIFSQSKNCEYYR